MSSSIGPPATPTCSMTRASLKRCRTSTGPPGAIAASKVVCSGSWMNTICRRSSPNKRRLLSTDRLNWSPLKSPLVKSRSALVDSTYPGGSPRCSRSTSPMRRSLSPSPYDAAVSMNVIGLASAARTVSTARDSGTEYANVSVMSPISAQPKHSGVTCRPVVPSGRRGSTVAAGVGCSGRLITLTYRAAVAASSGQPPAELVRMDGIDKSFPGVRALDDCRFELRAGEVHALCGENGAGKSTLMKVLAGIYPKDAGRILFKGAEVDIPTPRAARDLGISIIHQELSLMRHLTVAQNIFIGREPRHGPLRFWLDEDRNNQQTQHLLDRLTIKLEARAKVGELTVAMQQMVEIARAWPVQTEVLFMHAPA